MKRPVRSRHGFTVIELLLVVAILALLASIALPMFHKMTAKAKRAERTSVMKGIEQSMFTRFSQADDLPTLLGPGVSEINCDTNPPLPYSTLKKDFEPTMAGWDNLDFRATNEILYHYSAYGMQSPGLTYFWVSAVGDADGDGNYSFAYKWWIRNDDGRWSVWDEWETPPGEL